MAARERGRARMVAGLANHRRIEIVRLLLQGACGIDQSTAVEHLRRLHESGLVKKKSKGRKVLLSPSKRARAFIRAVDMLWELPE